MRPPLRPGTWRGSLVTLAGVLPVSLLLNVGFAPLVDRLLPHLLTVCINAVLLVAVLNWALLPLLHWTTKEWALRRRNPVRAPQTAGRRRA